MENIIKDYTSFNLWANQELITWLGKQPSEWMDQEIPSSFPTIKLTLLHIWGAEDVWLKRLMGESPSGFLSQSPDRDVQEVYDGLSDISLKFKNHVHAMSDQELMTDCPFRLLNGTEDVRKKYEMIHHCMNHSTYHRGQIVTLARNFGISDPPATDFIRYLRVR